MNKSKLGYTFKTLNLLHNILEELSDSFSDIEQMREFSPSLALWYEHLERPVHYERGTNMGLVDQATSEFENQVDQGSGEGYGTEWVAHWFAHWVEQGLTIEQLGEILLEYAKE